MVAATVLVAVGSLSQAQAPAQTLSVIKSQYRRLPVGRDVQRVAVGDREIASVEVVTNRELLILGRETGRTSLIVWFADGGLTETVITVQRDLSILQAALRRIHPSIEAESAPDREAIVLTGRVPDFAVSQQAEAVVRSYLGAGGRDLARVVLPSAETTGTPGTPEPAPAAAAQVAAGSTTTPASGTPTGAARLQTAVPPSGAVINLIQLDRVPALPEEKVREAIRSVGGERVTIRRVLRGNIRDDARDTLVLEGEVPNQIALVRTLQLAAQLFTGTTIDADDIEVMADESGGLASRTQDAQAQNSGGSFGARGSSGVFGGGGGGSGGARLNNQVRRNLARASVVTAARGRILSFVQVADLPQIRVNIRVFEVNREKLRSYTPVSAALGSSLRLPSSDPSPGASAAQGQGTRNTSGAAVQNVLAFLSGGFLNELQFTSNHVAVTQALALLERDGIARTLSSPSLTVLSGESARFQVGGEVPIPVAFSPAFGGQTTATPGIFTAVDFVSFGLQLEIRPLVGDNDFITLDVQPQVISPDAALTASLRETTGSNQTTTAFATRALRTSSRLPDGQSLLIGGLTTRNASQNTASTPGLGDVPGLGWLFKSFNRSEDALDLVIVVNPVILRTRLPTAPLWAHPSTDELLRQIGAGALGSSPSPRSPSSGDAALSGSQHR